MNIGQYEFKIPSTFVISTDDPNNEGVILTLDNPNGNAVIIQGNLNMIKDVYTKTLDKKESLKYLHELKFNAFDVEYNGYESSIVKLDTIGAIPFSIQTFKFMYEKLEFMYDIRIVQLTNDYYAFYTFDKAEHMTGKTNTTDRIIESLNQLNFQ